MTFIINAIGMSGKQYALSMEAESFQQVEEALNDLVIMTAPHGVGELICEVNDRRKTDD